MRTYLLLSPIFFMLTEASHVIQKDNPHQQETADKVSSYISEINCQNCAITGPTEGAYSTWRASIRTPEKRLPSGYCAVKVDDYWIDMDSGTPEISEKYETIMLWRDKKPSCVWSDDIDSIGVDGKHYTEIEAISLLDLITKILEQSKTGKCYPQYSCEDAVVSGLQSVRIENLAQIGHENGYITYDFIGGVESEGHAINMFTLKVNQQEKIMSQSSGYIEIDTSARP